MRALPVLLVLVAGCYAEVWGGVYPVSRHTTAPSTPEERVDRGVSYSIGASVGLWLDMYGVGVGVSNSNVSPEGVVTTDGGARAQHTVRATQLRLDVDLPLRWWNPWFFPRATLVMRSADSIDRCLTSDQPCSGAVVDDPAHGNAIFAGLTATFVSRSLAISAGPSYLHFEHDVPGQPAAPPSERYRSFGAQVRVQLRFAFGLEAIQFYTPSVIRPLPPMPDVCRPLSTNKDCWP